MSDHSSNSDIIVSLQHDGSNPNVHTLGQSNDNRLRTVDWNAVTEKLLLSSVIAHEAHRKTKLKNRTKWEMVVQDLFSQEPFKGFIPVQADSLARKFKRIHKDFDEKYLAYEGANPDLEMERMTEVDELMYIIHKDEMADKTDEDGNLIIKPKRPSRGHIRSLLSETFSSDTSNGKSGDTPSKTLHETVKDVLSSMLSLDDVEGHESTEIEKPPKKLKLDEVEKERLLRLESELTAAKAQERMSKTISDLYQDNRDLREENKKLHKEIEYLKKGHV